MERRGKGGQRHPGEAIERGPHVGLHWYLWSSCANSAARPGMTRTRSRVPCTRTCPTPPDGPPGHATGSLGILIVAAADRSFKSEVGRAQAARGGSRSGPEAGRPVRTGRVALARAGTLAYGVEDPVFRDARYGHTRARGGRPPRRWTIRPRSWMRPPRPRCPAWRAADRPESRTGQRAGSASVPGRPCRVGQRRRRYARNRHTRRR